MSDTFKIKKGLSNKVSTAASDNGTLLLTTDTNELFYGASKTQLTTSWNVLRDKPSSFKPSSHKHDWNDISNPPDFALNNHTHNDKYLQLIGGTLSGNLIISSTGMTSIACSYNKQKSNLFLYGWNNENSSRGLWDSTFNAIIGISGLDVASKSVHFYGISDEAFLLSPSKKNNTLSYTTSGWNGSIPSSTKHTVVWSQSWRDTTLSQDTGDMILWLSDKTTLNLTIDGNFYSMGNIVLNASNYNQYALPLSGGTITGSNLNLSNPNAQLNIGNGNLLLYSNGEGGNIQFHAGNGHKNTWEIDAYDGNLRFYTWRESDNAYQGIQIDQKRAQISSRLGRLTSGNWTGNFGSGSNHGDTPDGYWWVNLSACTGGKPLSDGWGYLDSMYNVQVFIGYPSGKHYRRMYTNNQWYDWGNDVGPVGTNIVTLDYYVGYYGIKTPNGNKDWIRTPTYGLLPSDPATAGGGISKLGTSGFMFQSIHVDDIYTANYGTGNPSSKHGMDGNGCIYFKII